MAQMYSIQRIFSVHDNPEIVVHFVNLCVWVRERERDGWSMEVGKYYQIVMVNLLYGILNNILPSEWHMICIKFE